MIEKQEDKILVVSKYALDCKPYNEKDENVTWENCTLHIWLNNDFINSAFTADEKTMIPTVIVANNDNMEFDTDGGNDTQDTVFLLSIDEAKKYFNPDEERKCATTEYAEMQGVDVNEENNTNGKPTCCWWLRSPGRDQAAAAYVRSNGEIKEFGHSADIEEYGVRPARWISVK